MTGPPSPDPAIRRRNRRPAGLGQSASFPRREHRPGLGTAGPCSGLVRRRPSTLRVGSQPGRLNQPRRNGLEVLNELKKTDPDLQTIAVVILTTSRAQQDILGSAAVLLA